jgi:hypothetical protein
LRVWMETSTQGRCWSGRSRTSRSGTSWRLCGSWYAPLASAAQPHTSPISGCPGMLGRTRCLGQPRKQVRGTAPKRSPFCSRWVTSFYILQPLQGRGYRAVPYREKAWRWRGYRVNYAEVGRGKWTLVLVHGFGGNVAHFRKVSGAPPPVLLGHAETCARSARFAHGESPTTLSRKENCRCRWCVGVL